MHDISYSCLEHENSCSKTWYCFSMGGNDFPFAFPIMVKVLDT
jgi:hypothetical protein